MFSSKKIIFFSSFIVSVSLGTFVAADTVHANEKEDGNELYITEGTEASEVKELEEALIVLGYPLQEADTLFDSNTSIHISEYQERNSFEVTGEVDQELLENILEDMKSAEESETSTNKEAKDQNEKNPSLEEASTDPSNSENEVEDESSDTSAGTKETSPSSSSYEENDEDSSSELQTQEPQKADSDDQDLEQEESDEDENTAEEPQDIEVDEEETTTQDVKTDADEKKAVEDEASIEQKEAAPQKATSFVLAANTFSTSAVSSSTLLKDGVTSPDAQAMKEDLYELGYLDIANPNEKFGPQTEAAVKAFQRDHGLVVDGVAGPNTLAKITEAMSTSSDSGSTLLQNGVTSPEAKAMKEDLHALGYLDIPAPTEQFGPKTEAAVKAFQRDHGLTADGVAGPSTLAKLSEVMSTSPDDGSVLQNGVTSPEAKAMKEDLHALGYLDIPAPTEQFGPKTEAAVKAFQRDHGLVVDGVAGPNTLAKITEAMSTSSDSGSTLLQNGVTSPEAKAMKEDLHALGYLDIPAPTEQFGPKTEAAVKAFQREHGLTDNGIADSATLSKLKEALEGEMNESIPSPFTSVLSQGESGDSVIMLKQYLEAAGYSTNTSSTYDQLTADQVKAYQSANGLSASGSANAQTLNSLVEKRGTTYVFSGKQRFGHGVGMTQWGAYGMAQQGYSYDEILKHYYTGIEIVSSDSYKNKTMRVLLGDTKKNSADIESSSAYSIVTTNGDTLFEKVSGSTTVTYGSGGNGTYTVTNNGTEKTTTDPIYAASANNGTIEYNEVTYKGEIHFSKSLVDGKYTSSWVMDVVNHVNIDTYLEGVVPYEMYTSWNEPDAYKAQAVAARSYAMTKIKTSGTFDVYNDTRSQVYHGVPTGSHNSPIILNAIQSTSGQAIHYNGRLVEGVYSASASGHTVDAADVWGNNIGYLIGVPDPYDPSQYNQVSWNESFSLKELSAVDYFKNENKGEVLALQPTMKNERLQSIDVIMEQGTITLTGDQFRSAVDSNAMKSNILSIEEIK